MTKQCNTCEEWLPLDDFYSFLEKGKRPVTIAACKSCFRARQKKSRDNGPNCRGGCGKSVTRQTKSGYCFECAKRNGVYRSRKGENSPHWKGGRFRSERDGYIYVTVNHDDPLAVMGRRRGSRGAAVYVHEHRLVMARHLGRPLLPDSGETVHHINGIRDDNRLENLQLRQGNHGAGAAYQCVDCGSANVKPVKLKDKEVAA